MCGGANTSRQKAVSVLVIILLSKMGVGVCGTEREVMVREEERAAALAKKEAVGRSPISSRFAPAMSWVFLDLSAKSSWRWACRVGISERGVEGLSSLVVSVCVSWLRAFVICLECEMSAFLSAALSDSHH